MSASTPEILWAQRSSETEDEKNVVMLTINVPNLPPAPATKLDLTPNGFDFHSKTGDKEKGIPDKEWAFKLDFFAEVVPEESKISQTSKSLYLVLRKKEKKEEYWPRLSKDKIRLHNVKTDFDKWRDEDEQDEFEDLGDGGMGGMGGMPPGMGGMGGMGGGAGGFDPSMLQGLGGGGGAGGMGGMDLQSMLANMGGGAGGMPDFGAEDDGDDDEADEAEAPEAAKVEETK
ncbi:unnamed protein product [Sympodiomycopsis kandeliae]